MESDEERGTAICRIAVRAARRFRVPLKTPCEGSRYVAIWALEGLVLSLGPGVKGES